jgi:hypothetical protein
MLVCGGVDGVGNIAVWGDLRLRFGFRPSLDNSESCNLAMLSPEPLHLHIHWIDINIIEHETHIICTLGGHLPIHTHTHFTFQGDDARIPIEGSTGA